MTDAARNMVLTGAGLSADGTITSSFEAGHIGNIRSILPEDGEGDEDDDATAAAKRKDEPEARGPRAGAGRPHRPQAIAEVDG